MDRRRTSLPRRVAHRALVLFGAAVATAVFFLVLPLTQVIADDPEADLVLQVVDTANIPPPPPPPEEEPPEPEPEEAPPEMAEEAEPLDLSELELALEPAGLGEGFLAGNFDVRLDTVASLADVDELFSLSELDQEPRVTYQPGPVLNAKLRKKGPGTVWVIFVVDAGGRVESPKVQASFDPAFDGAALAAVKQWKFDPGLKNGKPVRSRLRVPITFPGPQAP